MAAQALKHLGAGYNLAEKTYSSQLTLKTTGTSPHIVSFQTPHKDTQLLFHFDESYPSRVPKVVINSPTLTADQKDDLCELLQNKGKAEEYSNTPLLPLLLEQALKWLAGKYGQKTSSKSTKLKEPRSEFREECWQLAPLLETGIKMAAEKKPIMTQTTEADKPQTKKKKTAVIKATAADLDEKNQISFSNINEDITGIISSASYDPLAKPSYDRGQNSEVDDWTVVKTKDKQNRNDEKEKVENEKSDKGLFTMDTVPHISVPEDTRRANHFVSIRCTNSEIGDAVTKTIKKILAADSVYEPIAYNKNEVHVTLTTVALHSESDIQKAVKALEDAKDVLVAHAPTSCLTISGIDNFQGSKVVFGKVEVMEDVLLFRKVIRWAFLKAGISPRDNFDYHPHMTLVKTNMSFTRKTGLKTIQRDTYTPLLDTHFGKQGVKAIHLCRMGSERRPDGYYICPTEIVLKK